MLFRSAQTYRADIRVRRIAKLGRAAAEDLGAGQKLDVDFQPDDRLVPGLRGDRGFRRGGHRLDYSGERRGSGASRKLRNALEMCHLLPTPARCHPKIVLRLHARPEFRRRAESIGQPQCQVGGNARPATQHPRQCYSRDSKMFRCRRDGQLAQVLSQHQSRMWRVKHTHNDDPSEYLGSKSIIYRPPPHSPESVRFRSTSTRCHYCCGFR